MDEKFRSRRWKLAHGVMAHAAIALHAGVVGMLIGRDMSGLAALMAAFTGTAALVLGAYGYTRSKWGAVDDRADAD